MPRKASTTARGYGSVHQRIRKQYARLVEQGQAICCRCGLQILPGSPFDLDHTDTRDGYNGPAHPTCNRSAGGRKAAQRQQHLSVRW